MKKYVATQLFTQKTLPAGSYVYVEDGIVCDAVVWESYRDRSSAKTINDILDGDKIKITQAWWQGVEACAFNFSWEEENDKALEEIESMVKVMGPNETTNYNWDDDGVLKLLTVGNSFSDDLIQHVYQIAKDVGVKNIELGNLSYSACRIWQHYGFWSGGEAVYTYHYNTNGTWQTKSNVSFEEAFITTDWDYISFQESAAEKQSNSLLYQDLPDLIDMAKERCPNAKIVWHMPWPNNGYGTNAYYLASDDPCEAMYLDLCKAVRSLILPLHDIAMVIPSGTAIQNMRTSTIVDNSLLLIDGWHLSHDLGRYIVGLTCVKQLTGLSIDNVTWVPNENCKQYRQIAIEAANNAVKAPYTITKSTYLDTAE